MATNIHDTGKLDPAGPAKARLHKPNVRAGGSRPILADERVLLLERGPGKPKSNAELRILSTFLSPPLAGAGHTAIGSSKQLAFLAELNPQHSQQSSSRPASILEK
jgi:hypothetical protein